MQQTDCALKSPIKQLEISYKKNKNSFSIHSTSPNPSLSMSLGLKNNPNIYTKERLLSLFTQTYRLPTGKPLSSVESVLHLEGFGILFNPAPPEKEEWLEGKLTPQEYYHCVHKINNAVARALKGSTEDLDRWALPKDYAIIDKSIHQTLKAINETYVDRNLVMMFFRGNNVGTCVREACETHLYIIMKPQSISVVQRRHP